MTQTLPNFDKKAAASSHDSWTTADAESLGLDQVKLKALTEAFAKRPELGAHAILIERAGQLVYEEYLDGPDEKWGMPLGHVTINAESLHDLRSVTKSVVSALVGIAVSEDAIKSLDQPVVVWFPEFSELDTPERRRVTLAHVLSMTAGFEWNEEVPYSDPRNDEIRMNQNAEPLRYVLSRPFVADPGSEFKYNGGLTQVMAAVLERATKTSLEEYARTRLFAPLGIMNVEWMGNLAGMPSAASGLRLRARDLAKFGSLFLHRGKWKGEQLISESWIEQSTRRKIAFPTQPGEHSEGEFGYSYFWWHACYQTAAGPIEAYVALGNGQQRIFVLPALNMAVTVFAGRYNDFSPGAMIGRKILLEYVIPAVKTGVGNGRVSF